MKSENLFIKRDQDDRYFFHLYYKTKSGFSFLCSFHGDNLLDVCGREFYDEFLAEMKQGEFIPVTMSLEFEEV